jgi:Ran GTPase-activating protein (RanGAP) involved in mRNA processing and transport
MGNLFAKPKTHWVPVNREIAQRIETVADWTDKTDFSSLQMQNDLMAKEMVIKFSICVTLIEVNLSFNGLGDVECIPIAKAIRESGTMRRLYLFNNNIHAKGAQALAFALMPRAGQGDPTLEELSLRNNSVGAEGAQGLALVFSCNKRLRKMDLHWNNIRNIGLNAICMNLPAAPLPADFRVVIHVLSLACFIVPY